MDDPKRTVRVTRAQKLAAQLLIERSKVTGRHLSPAVAKIANAGHGSDAEDAQLGSDPTPNNGLLFS